MEYPRGSFLCSTFWFSYSVCHLVYHLEVCCNSHCFHLRFSGEGVSPGMSHWSTPWAVTLTVSPWILLECVWTVESPCNSRLLSLFHLGFSVECVSPVVSHWSTPGVVTVSTWTFQECFASGASPCSFPKDVDSGRTPLEYPIGCYSHCFILELHEVCYPVLQHRVPRRNVVHFSIPSPWIPQSATHFKAFLQDKCIHVNPFSCACSALSIENQSSCPASRIKKMAPACRVYTGLYSQWSTWLYTVES